MSMSKPNKMTLVELAAFADQVGDESAQDMLVCMGAVSSHALAAAMIAKARMYVAASK
jgi:hypothetical protein